MNITKENINDLNAVLKVQVDKNDYEEKVEKILKDYRKKANIKGFRPGMVPIGLVRKMYGKAVQVDEINKLVSESIQKYLSDEKIEILGDPMPKSDENDLIDFDTQEDFTFSFELGLAPSFELNLSKKNKVPSYEIAVSDDMKDKFVQNYARRFGEFVKAETTAENDLVKGNVTAIDENGNPAPDGPAAEETSLAVNIIKDEEIKNLFIGKTVGDAIDFDINKALPNEGEIAGFLKKQKDEVKDINGNFRFTITEISHFESAQIDKDLFDKIYGEGVVSTEEEFMNKIVEEISANLKLESDFKLAADIKKTALDKTDFELPEDFLKRWLLRVNENTNAEQIEKEFDSFKNDLKWQLIRNKVARENEIKISEEEMLKEAEVITRNQFRQYGLYYATDEQVTNYAKETLRREDDARRIADRILDEKVIGLIKEMVKIETKNVTDEEFNKLFE